jgi:hypothetical protein
MQEHRVKAQSRDWDAQKDGDAVGTVRPLKDAKPVTLEFEATISEDYVNEVIDREGVRPASRWGFEFDLGEIEGPEIRQRLRRAHERYLEVEPYPELDRPEEDPERFLDTLEPWLTMIEEGVAKEEKENALEEERKKKLMSEFAVEMQRWVSEHGSRRLRLAIARDYRSNTSYALERLVKELPGFWLDSADDCKWGERADPSEEALLLEEAVRNQLAELGLELDTRIVWLTETPRALDRMLEAEEIEFEPQEAVKVADYLGRYLLVMPVEENLRRDPEEES